jgi:hypothetical protein
LQGFHELDLKNRLLEFAKLVAANSRQPSGWPLPSVALHAGSYFPNHPDPLLDKSSAKIINCSKRDLAECKNSWGLMFAEKAEIMQAKTQAGRFTRNQPANLDYAASAGWRQRANSRVAFLNNNQLGAFFSLWVPASNSEQPNQTNLQLDLTKAISAPSSIVDWGPNPYLSRPYFGTAKPFT